VSAKKDMYSKATVPKIGCSKINPVIFNLFKDSCFGLINCILYFTGSVLSLKIFTTSSETTSAGPAGPPFFFFGPLNTASRTFLSEMIPVRSAQMEGVYFYRPSEISVSDKSGDTHFAITAITI